MIRIMLYIKRNTQHHALYTKINTSHTYHTPTHINPDAHTYPITTQYHNTTFTNTTNK